MSNHESTDERYGCGVEWPWFERLAQDHGSARSVFGFRFRFRLGLRGGFRLGLPAKFDESIALRRSQHGFAIAKDRIPDSGQFFFELCLSTGVFFPYRVDVFPLFGREIDLPEVLRNPAEICGGFAGVRSLARRENRVALGLSRFFLL